MEKHCLEELLYAFDECFDGEGEDGGIFLEPEDPGLLTILAALDAKGASVPVAGLSIANNVYHLLFALDVFIRRIKSDESAFHVDWSVSWLERPLNEAEWLDIKNELVRLRGEIVSAARDNDAYKAGYDKHLRLIMGLLSHTVFHLGIIRIKYDELIKLQAVEV